MAASGMTIIRAACAAHNVPNKIPREKPEKCPPCLRPTSYIYSTRTKEQKLKKKYNREDVPLVEFIMYLVFILCRGKVTVNNWYLCCCVHVTCFERRLTPLFVE